MRGEGGAVGIIDRADLSVTMSQWSSEHRAFAVERFFKSNDSYVDNFVDSSIFGEYVMDRV